MKIMTEFSVDGNSDGEDYASFAKFSAADHIGKIVAFFAQNVEKKKIKTKRGEQDAIQAAFVAVFAPTFESAMIFKHALIFPNVLQEKLANAHAVGAIAAGVLEKKDTKEHGGYYWTLTKPTDQQEAQLNAWATANVNGDLLKGFTLSEAAEALVLKVAPQQTVPAGAIQPATAAGVATTPAALITPTLVATPNFSSGAQFLTWANQQYGDEAVIDALNTSGVANVLTATMPQLQAVADMLANGTPPAAAAVSPTHAAQIAPMPTAAAIPAQTAPSPSPVAADVAPADTGEEQPF